MDEKEKKTNKENENRLLLALAGLFLAFSPESIEDVPSNALKTAQELMKKHDLKEVADIGKRLSEEKIQETISDIANDQYGVDVFEIRGTKDGHTCKACLEWQGKRVTYGENNLGLPTVQDFIDSNGLHPNCRCSLHLVKDLKQNEQLKKDIIERKKKALKEKLDFYGSNQIFFASPVEIKAFS